MYPEWVVCPRCHGSLQGDPLRCTACHHEYQDADGVVDFTVGPRFEDESDGDRDAVEEEMDGYTVRSYLLPRLAEAQRGAGHRLRVLSLGCGVGCDVDLINDAGFEGVGVDCGSRVHAWRRRKYPQSLYQASALNLPFADGTFDVIFSGCVLAHIGVEGDSRKLTPQCADERQRFCAEAARVTRKGGHLILSGPNRWCPVDLFHRDSGYMPRFHTPAERFLASFGDIRAMFHRQPGVTRVVPLPNAGYWRFNGLTRKPLGKALARLLTWHFHVVSWEAMPLLRRTFLNPWLVVRIDK